MLRRRSMGKSPVLTREPEQGTRRSSWSRGVGTPAERRALLVIVAVALLLRVVWCLVAAGQPRIGDPASYYIQGVQIAHGEGYNSVPVHLQRAAAQITTGSATLPGRDVPTAWAPPGYPAILGAIFWLVLHTPLPDRLVAAAASLNVVLGVGTIILVFEIVRRLFDTRTALVAAALLAVYPNLIFHTATMHWETTFLFVTMAALLALVATPPPSGRGPSRGLVVLSVLLGIAVLIRPIALPMIPLVLVLARLRGADVRTALAQCGLVLAIVSLMIVPWTVRNIVKVHSPVVISTDLGIDLCRSRRPKPQVGHDRNNNRALLRRYCLPTKADAPGAEQTAKSGNYAMGRAIRFVADHPLEEAKLWEVRARYAYREDHDALEDAGFYVAPNTLRRLATVADWFGLSMLALAAMGARQFVRRGSPERAYVACTAVALAMTPMVLYGMPRHKVPAMVLFVMASAVGLVSLFDWASSRAQGAI